MTLFAELVDRGDNIEVIGDRHSKLPEGAFGVTEAILHIDDDERWIALKLDHSDSKMEESCPISDLTKIDMMSLRCLIEIKRSKAATGAASMHQRLRSNPCSILWQSNTKRARKGAEVPDTPCTSRGQKNILILYFFSKLVVGYRPLQVAGFHSVKG